MLKNSRNQHAQKHGLGMPNEAFFHWNPELLDLGRQIGQINSRAFGVLLANLSAPILVQRVPCPCFQLFNHCFYKKLSLIHIPNDYFLQRFFVYFNWMRFLRIDHCVYACAWSFTLKLIHFFFLFFFSPGWGSRWICWKVRSEIAKGSRQTWRYLCLYLCFVKNYFYFGVWSEKKGP